MPDEAKLSPIDGARAIAKTVGELQAATIQFRRQGLPPKFLAGLDAIDGIMNRLADQNAALGDAVRAAEAPAPESDAKA